MNLPQTEIRKFKEYYSKRRAAYLDRLSTEHKALAEVRDRSWSEYNRPEVESAFITDMAEETRKRFAVRLDRILKDTPWYRLDKFLAVYRAKISLAALSTGALFKTNQDSPFLFPELQSDFDPFRTAKNLTFVEKLKLGIRMIQMKYQRSK